MKKILYPVFILLLCIGTIYGTYEYFKSGGFGSLFSTIKITQYNKEIPPDFPKQFILENEPIDSSTVVSKGSSEQIVISYLSKNSVPVLMSMYKNTTVTDGWHVVVNKNDLSLGIITMTKDNESLIITMTYDRLGARVGFQYSK